MRSNLGERPKRLFVLGIAAGSWVSLHAQGVLTISPGRVAASVSGTGVSSYSGDGGVAMNAALANPSAVAFDASGNLFLADANNHVIREISAAGTITTVAGAGVAGFSGDGGPAAAALLDTPLGVALDPAGNLYIADSHNHRIRKISNGTITTIAGTGVAGFSGDNGVATAAQLALPSAVALSASGSLYIADTDNHRVRRLTGGVLTTVAGNGEELLAGDGGAATAASLDSPTGVAVDAAGRLYIADRHNQRIRMVDSNGTITTVAGNTTGFSGGYSGDGGNAPAAALAKPTGVTLDSAGNVLIADTNNNRIRQISGGTIATLAGTGDQGFGGDGGPLVSALLNAPRSLATDSSGNLVIADTLNQRLRSARLATLTFGNQTVGVPSPTQSITLSNTGSANLNVTQLSFSGAFTASSGGSCSALPVSLAPGASCTENLSFLPTTVGVATGSVLVGGTGLLPQTVLLAGTAVASSTTTTLAASSSTALIGQSILFTATVKPAGAGVAGGTITFFDSGRQIASAQPLTNNSASLAITTLSAGTHSLTAVYSGDANFAGGTSPVFTELVSDFDFTIDSSSPASSADQTVVPGQSATYALTIRPLAGPFSFPVALTAQGLPSGATATFTPQTITVGSTPVGFTMTIHAPAVASLEHRELFGGGAVTLALVLLPFSAAFRRKAKRLGGLATIAILAGSGIFLTSLTGCGTTNSGFFGQAQKSYTVQVVGTATGTSGATLQHAFSVKLTVQ